MTSLHDAQVLLDLWLSGNWDGDPGALATIVSVKGSAYRHPGARMLFWASGRSAGMISGGCLESDIRERAREGMSSGIAKVVTYDTASPSDVVFGLGLGCNGVVRVIVEPLTVGTGADVILTQHPSEALKSGDIAFSGETAAVIMSHHFQRDKEFLGLCLSRCAVSTGVLGPRVRTQRMIDELWEEAEIFAADQLHRLFGPAGLDLGAETPAEIALSIIAEIRAVMGGRAGGFLRDRTGPIHELELGLLECE